METRRTHQTAKRNRPKVPVDKRRRTELACTRCRINKKKCIRLEGGTCNNCQRSGIPCLFEPVAKAPVEADLPSSSAAGIELPSTETQLHSICIDVINNFVQSCPNVSLEADDRAKLSHMLIEKLLTPATRQQPGDNGISPLSEIQRIVTASPIESMEHIITPVIDEETSLQGFLTSASKIMTSLSLNSIQSARAKTMVQGDHCRHSWATSELIIQALQGLPPLAEALFHTTTFFTLLESNWYYFDEAWFRQLLTSLYRPVSTDSVPSSTNVCLALVVLALGSTFSHLRQPNLSWSSPQPRSPAVPGATLYHHALSLVSSVIGTDTLESIQCCLLIALYPTSVECLTHHATYLGLALRKAVLLSMHTKSVDSEINVISEEIRNRVFWTVYCLERRAALSMGRPEMLSLKDITTPLPERTPGLDDPLSSRVDRMVAFINLTLISGEVLRIQPCEVHRGKLEWIRSLLGEWKASSPPQTSEEYSARQVAHLEIMYNMIWIQLGQQALLKRVRMRLPGDVSSASKTDTSDPIHDELAEACVTSGAAIIDRLDLLQDANQLAPYSFTDVHSCLLATFVLLLESVSTNATTEVSTDIDKALALLRFLALTNKKAEKVLLIAESFHNAIKATRPAARCHQDGDTWQEDANSVDSGDSVCTGTDNVELAETLLNSGIFDNFEEDFNSFTDWLLSQNFFHG